VRVRCVRRAWRVLYVENVDTKGAYEEGEERPKCFADTRFVITGRSFETEIEYASGDIRSPRYRKRNARSDCTPGALTLNGPPEWQHAKCPAEIG